MDDSISTTPETALAGLKSFSQTAPMTLIVGGQNRGQDYTVLIDYLVLNRHRIKLITLPDTGKIVYEMARASGIETYYFDTMEQAVKKAKIITPMGGIILLSPAAPSYNMYQNFEERGNDFKKWAMLNFIEK